MSRFCLDSNILIQAKNGPYPFDIFPSFWKWLNEQVQKKFAEIINYVQQNNRSEADAEKFLSGADPWVIAHALVGMDQIVTHEKRVPEHSKKIKIPNVCDVFGEVTCMDTYQLMRKLKAQL